MSGDYAPGFFIKHFIKDMDLALNESKKEGLNLEVLEMVLAHYQTLEANGDLRRWLCCRILQLQMG